MITSLKIRSGRIWEDFRQYVNNTVEILTKGIWLVEPNVHAPNERLVKCIWVKLK